MKKEHTIRAYLIILYILIVILSLYYPVYSHALKISKIILFTIIGFVMVLGAILVSLNTFKLFPSVLFFNLLYFCYPLIRVQEKHVSIHFPGISYIIPMALYLSMVLIFKPLKRNVNSLKIGRVDSFSVLISGILVFFSAIGIVGWKELTQPAISSIVSWIPRVHPLLLIAGGFGFAVSNSFVEELLFRGILWDGLEASNFHKYTVIIIQAAFFSIWHFKGFPGGIFGTLLVFMWGVFLGLIRQRTGGLCAPVLAHICADLTIFIIIFLEILT